MNLIKEARVVALKAAWDDESGIWDDETRAASDAVVNFALAALASQIAALPDAEYESADPVPFSVVDRASVLALLAEQTGGER